MGGKRDNMAKWIVCPEATAPLTVMVKLLVRDAGDDVGLSLTVSCLHVVWAPLNATEVVAKT